MYVDGRPFLILGGELHNSSPSSTAYMEPIWKTLSGLHLNTVIGAASWELVEPEQGHYDFKLVDAQIAEARKRGIHLVLIWFASYKNAESRYAPTWVRKDLSKYPRVVFSEKNAGDNAFAGMSGAQAVLLSPVSDSLASADAKAFAALMKHIREVDPAHTVMMMQVENEMGMLGDSRDHSVAAEDAWKEQVPDALLNYMQKHKDLLRPELTKVWARQGNRTKGNWAEVFGEDWQADEIFMAWQFATFTNRVAKAGKAELPIPMYVNAWLGPQPHADKAGQYPSGGPVAKMMDVWKAGAPSIDLEAPDIYVPQVDATFADYTRADNPLFTPETQPIAGDIFRDLGAHSGMGYSVFGIEESPTDGQIASAYQLLVPAIPAITAGQAAGKIRGFALDTDQTFQTTLGDWDISVAGIFDAMKKYMLDAGMAPPKDTRVSRSEGRGLMAPVMTDMRPSGLILQLGPDEFLLMGSGFSFNFKTAGGKGSKFEVDSMEEGSFDNGRWVPGRRLNGDERYSPLPVDHFGMVRVRLIRPR